MFTNQHHLKHLLRPEHYTSAEQYRLELRHLFQPAWHPLAVKSDLAKPGDFLTFDLLETPILVRNFDGELRAFLNVCPHRHSRLTGKARGNTEKLRCQYHGWEFNENGGTGKIPDAKAFRPWDRENACLKSFRVDTCGDLVFVNFQPTGPTLREWIGPVWEVWQSYGGAYRHAATWEADFPCNWKVVLENSLESYHIPQVHPTTFKDYSTEENSWHELTDRFTSYKTIPPRGLRGAGAGLVRAAARRARDGRVLAPGRTPARDRRVHGLVPHATVRVSHRPDDVPVPVHLLYPAWEPRTNPLAWATYRTLRSVATIIGKKVFAEDGSIYDGVQRGMESSPHPGVIGTSARSASTTSRSSCWTTPAARANCRRSRSGRRRTGRWGALAGGRRSPYPLLPLQPAGPAFR